MFETLKVDPSELRHKYSSTGCILGGSALGSPRSSGEAVGKKAAEELLEAIETGGTVDKYIQVTC